MEPGGVRRLSPLRLAHGWKLVGDPGVPVVLVREFIRPAVRAVPSSIARRLTPTRIDLTEEVGDSVASRWKSSGRGLEVHVTRTGAEHHDIAMELLLCLGQALWQKLSRAEQGAFWRVLRDEIDKGIEGEIDDHALEEKRCLFGSRVAANDAMRLNNYGAAAFAGTAAEYVHCLWHEVTVRSGSEHLPAQFLRRRLELLARWFPPNPGYRLFPKNRS